VDRKACILSNKLLLYQTIYYFNYYIKTTLIYQQKFNNFIPDNLFL